MMCLIRCTNNSPLFMALLRVSNNHLQSLCFSASWYPLIDLILVLANSNTCLINFDYRLNFLSLISFSFLKESLIFSSQHMHLPCLATFSSSFNSSNNTSLPLKHGSRKYATSCSQLNSSCVLLVVLLNWLELWPGFL